MEQAEIFLAQGLSGLARPVLVAVLGQKLAGVEIKRGTERRLVSALLRIAGRGFKGRDVNPEWRGRAEGQDLILKAEVVQGMGPPGSRMRRAT